MRFLDQILGLVLVHPLLNRRKEWEHYIMTINFLLAQKFRLCGAKMDNGMMQLLRLLHQMGIMSLMMDGETRKSSTSIQGGYCQCKGGRIQRLLEAEKVAEATKHAIKRKIAQAASVDFQSRYLPAKLKIASDDPEDVKAAKKKIHAFKSKMRLEQLEVAQNKRPNAWPQFQTTKGKTKKVGFFSGRKHESIF